jgi:hypothetical protein
VPEGFAEHRGAIAILMAGHTLRRLNSAHRTFGGDLLLTLVLTEIAVHVRATDAAFGAGDEHGAEQDSPVYRLTPLSGASGLPRESARRKVLRLLELGWLEPAGRARVRLSVHAREYFGFEHNRHVLDDFLWTTERLDGILAPVASEAVRPGQRRDFSRALATRSEDHPEPLFSTELEPPSARLPEQFARRVADAAGLTLAGFLLRHLHRMREAFGGDLILPLLLGEIGHYNAGSLMHGRGADLANLDALMSPTAGADVEAFFRRVLRPCNAYSLGLVTGVPDSTVRRKVAVLVERGWVSLFPNGGYVVTPRPAMEFERLNVTQLHDFFATASTLKLLLRPVTASASALAN